MAIYIWVNFFCYKHIIKFEIAIKKDNSKICKNFTEHYPDLKSFPLEICLKKFNVSGYCIYKFGSGEV